MCVCQIQMNLSKSHVVTKENKKLYKIQLETKNIFNK